MLFRQNKQHKSEVALGIDLGSSQIKAVVVQQNLGKLQLVECVVRSLPAGANKSYKEAEFVAELQQLVNSLKTTERRAFVTISCSSAMVCHAEFPPVPLAEIKSALKLNSAGYLRRDFSAYYLDVFELKKGTDGLLHVSNVGPGRVDRIEDVLDRGDIIDVLVQEVDKERGRIGLKLVAKHDNGGLVMPETLIEQAKEKAANRPAGSDDRPERSQRDGERGGRRPPRDRR